MDAPDGPAGSLVVLPGAEALGAFAADAIAARIRGAVARRGRFDLVLAGGTTPEPAHRHLALRHRDDVPWDAVRVWYGDERCVPPDDPRSNHAAAVRSLLARVPIRAEFVRRMRGEDPPEHAAALYEQALRSAWPDAAAPEFDLVLLGVGGDGHTASLFPGSPVLAERLRWVSAATAPAEPRDRVTLTLPGLAGAREVAFLVSGASKRAVLAEVRAGGAAAAARYPAAALAALRPVAWWTDAAAAAGTASPPAR